MDTTTYSVVMSGDIRTGFEPELVANAFAKLFKVSPEKASSLMGTKRVLKKGVDLNVAETYKSKLHGIGLHILLEKHEPVVAEQSVVTLSPQITTQAAVVAAVPAKAIQEKPPAKPPVKPSIPNGMVCPKCSLEQVKAEECIGCGVYVNKVKPAAVVTASGVVLPPAQDAEEDFHSDDEMSRYTVLVAPAVAAILGALLWYFIAVVFKYEHSLVAWGIGGAIGFAAATAGAYGDKAGVFCAVLVLLSILGGKYMTMASFQSDWAEQISVMKSTDIQSSYEEDLNSARQFNDSVTDEASLRTFMLEYSYSEAYEESKITADEISNFKEYIQPTLEKRALNPPSLAEWRELRASVIDEFSTFDLVFESLDLIDMLFLFLGMGTAFKLGRGEE